jgi:hypothetical protein
MVKFFAAPCSGPGVERTRPRTRGPRAAAGAGGRLPDFRAKLPFGPECVALRGSRQLLVVIYLAITGFQVRTRFADPQCSA